MGVGLTSANFVVIERRRGTLKRVLSAHCLNVSQYRLLLLLDHCRDEDVRLQELASLADFGISTTTMCVDALEKQGFAERVVDKLDARSRLVRVTDAGRAEIAHIHQALIDGLYEAFNLNDDPTLGPLLVKGIFDGARIEGVWPKEVVNAYPTSANLLAVDLLAQRLEKALRRKLDIGYNEARVVQRMGDVGHPMRVSDLSSQLELSMATVTRVVQRLERRGWVARYASLRNRVAVFLEMTNAGGDFARQVAGLLDELGNDIYWSRLAPEYAATVKSIANVFQGRMDEADKASLSRDASLLADGLEALPV